MLCSIPPITLTPTVENLSKRFRRIIAVRLSAAPATLYARVITFPKRIAIQTILTSETATASFAPSLYSANITAIFASPSLIPGTANDSGIRLSI